MEKCTAWPWSVKVDNEFNRPCYRVIAEDGFPGAPNYRVLAVLMGGDTDEEEKANAHLMASAKELYEALMDARIYVRQAWLRAGDNDQGEDATFAKVDAAIAKARGES